MALVRSLTHLRQLTTMSIPKRNELAAALARVADPSFDSVELFHTSHPRWPLSQRTPQTTAGSKESDGKRIHIAVFDSSYNPPTRAHFAISLTSFPPAGLSSESLEIRRHDGQSEEEDPYTARLLLLSARNVDKTLKPGDATFDQRIEMMHLQALDMEERSTSSRTAEKDASAGNVAVAALNHPTFVGKSGILLRWFRERRLAELGLDESKDSPTIRLTFLIGTDTLTRLFIPKYYEPSPTLGSTMQDHLRKFFTTDNSDIVVAHRGASPKARAEEEAFIQRSEDARTWIERGKLRFVRGEEVSPEEREMSSTRVRKAVAAGSDDELRVLVGERVREYIEKEGLYRS
jgi:nicotinamide-nucleotide adenylyltransferase